MMLSSDLIEQRATNLAIVFLTRDSRVKVNREYADRGLDLQVTIIRNHQVTGRVFGVEVKARLNISRVGRPSDGDKLKLGGDLRTTLERTRLHLRDYPFPVLLMVFAMDSDRGFFAWLREPSGTQLRSPAVTELKEWGSLTHREVIDAVDEWYTERR